MHTYTYILVSGRGKGCGKQRGHDIGLTHWRPRLPYLYLYLYIYIYIYIYRVNPNYDPGAARWAARMSS